MDRRAVMASGAAAIGLAACAPNAPKSTPMTLAQTQARLSGFAVNVESWWRDIPFETRFDKAAAAGFLHAEFWFIDSWDRSAREIAAHIPSGLNISQIVGDTPALARTDVRAEFLENCKVAIENAKILNTEIVTLTGHQDVEGVSKTDALKSYADHMAAAAPLFEAAKVVAAIEPFNPYNHPGHFIYGHTEALRICELINSPFMKINWDLFHMQRHEGNLIDNLQKGAAQIGYMQLADSPDRHQPGTGEIDYVSVIRACRAAGYTRPIGLELWAQGDDYDRALSDILRLTEDMEAA